MMQCSSRFMCGKPARAYCLHTGHTHPHPQSEIIQNQSRDSHLKQLELHSGHLLEGAAQAGVETSGGPQPFMLYAET